MTHTHTHAHALTLTTHNTHTHTHSHTHACTLHKPTHTLTHTHTHIYIHIHAPRTNVHTHTRNTHSLTLTRTHAHRHSHTHAHTHHTQEFPRIVERGYHEELHYWDYCYTYSMVGSIYKSVVSGYYNWVDPDRIMVYPDKTRRVCGWDEYMDEWTRFYEGKEMNSILMTNPKDYKYYLSEKTPRYMISPHVASIFNHYINRFSDPNFIKFYVLIRNPITKVWSHFYRRCRTHWSGMISSLCVWIGHVYAC